MTDFVHPDLMNVPPPNAPRPVVAFISDIFRGGGLDFHSHDRAQFISVVRGSMAVTVEAGTYVVPPQRALWIPAGVVHETRHLASTQLRTLYVTQKTAPYLPSRTTFIHMSDLLRSLMDEIVSFPRDYPEGGPEERLMAVFLDQIRVSEGLPLHLPMPRSQDLRAIADALAHEEEPGESIHDLARAYGMSARTLERRFKEQTSITVREFKKQAKLFRAVQLLAAGKSVSATSEIVGFENPSAFIAMFRATLGVTPGSYLKTPGRRREAR